MRYLILGSTGFIGSALKNRLQKEGKDIVCTSRSLGLDLLDYEKLENFVKVSKPDVIYNLATHAGSVHYYKNNASKVYSDNVQMALNVYKSVSSVSKDIKVIQPFSNCSYPGDVTIQKEEEWLNGPVHDSVSAFGNSKRATYYLSKAFNQQHQIRSINLMFPNAFGPGDTTDLQKTHALNGMIIRMIQSKNSQEKQFVVWGTGSPIREWIYIDDFVTALVESVKLDCLIEPVNVGQHAGYSIRQSAEAIKQCTGFEGDIVFDTTYQDGAPIKIMEGKKFQSLFPNFSWHNHHLGINKTVRYYQEIL